jgi:predicted RNase H-like nuclease (RuvC/YqgF family)
MPTKLSKEESLIKRLEQSNVSLQSKTIDLIKSINSLTKKIDNLVGIFEKAAKEVKETKLSEEEVKELSFKLENLLDQNKNLARGLLLLEKYVRSRTPLNVPPKPLTEYGKL